MSVYLALTPEDFAALPPQKLERVNRRVLIGTAVSGGSLRELLEDAVRLYGAKRITLDVQRLAMDFPLPCPSGEGRILTRRELATLRARSSAPVYFSRELCARYFTYCAGPEARLVLFDDARTLREKLRLARSLGIEDAFFMYPEIEDILEEIY